MHLLQVEWFQVIIPKLFFLSFPGPSGLPEDYFLHEGHCGYGLHLLPPLPREELSVLEVIKHDDEKAHVVIWLEHEKNRVPSLRIFLSSHVNNRWIVYLEVQTEALRFIRNDLESRLWMTDDLWLLGSSFRIISTFQILLISSSQRPLQFPLLSRYLKITCVLLILII